MKIQLFTVLLMSVSLSANKTLRELRHQEQLLAKTYYQNVTHNRVSFSDLAEQKSKLAKVQRKIQKHLSEQASPQGKSRKGLKRSKGGKSFKGLDFEVYDDDSDDGGKEDPYWYLYEEKSSY